jgi:hypothetical protein
MEMRINLHSLIDVITNSSSEIFLVMNSNAVKGMFEIIDEILKVGGSGYRAEELFTVDLEQDYKRPAGNFIRQYSKKWDRELRAMGEKRNKEFENDEVKALIEGFEDIRIKANKSGSYTYWRDEEKYLKDKIVPYLLIDDRYENYLDGEYTEELPSWLVVKAKDQSASTMEIWGKIQTLFEPVEMEY